MYKWLGFFFSLSLYINSLQAEPFYCFKVPSNWKPIDLSKFPKSVKIAFIAPSKKNFKPSINLAIEAADVPLSTYIQAVKKQHTINRKNKWCEMGYVMTFSGKAHIAQIDSKTAECGDVRMLQSILVEGGYAYILTAVASKEDFLDYHNQFLKTFESLEISPDLMASIHERDTQQLLNSSLLALKANLKIFQEKHKELTTLEAIKHKTFIKNYLKPFDLAMSKTFPTQGQAWNILAREHILKNLSSAQTDRS